jgi:hypothetical protein
MRRIGVFVVALAVLAACSSDETTADDFDPEVEEFVAEPPLPDDPLVPAIPPAPAGPAATYLLAGTAPEVSVTLNNETGGTEQFTTTLPYERALPTAPPNGFVYISAQNQADYGDVTCTITAGFGILQTATSSGAYVIATCSGGV